LKKEERLKILEILSKVQLIFHDSDLEQDSDLAVNEEKLKALLEKKEAEKIKLNSVLEKNTRRFNNFTKTQLELRDRKLSSLDEKEKSLNRIISNLENSPLIEQNKAIIENLNNDIKGYEEDKKFYSEYISELEKKIKQKEKEFKKIPSSEQLAKAALITELKNLNDDLSYSRSEYQLQDEMIALSKEEIAIANNEIDQLNEQIEEYRKQLANIPKERKKIESEVKKNILNARKTYFAKFGIRMKADGKCVANLENASSIKKINKEILELEEIITKTKKITTIKEKLMDVKDKEKAKEIINEFFSLIPEEYSCLFKDNGIDSEMEVITAEMEVLKTEISKRYIDNERYQECVTKIEYTKKEIAKLNAQISSGLMENINYKLSPNKKKIKESLMEELYVIDSKMDGYKERLVELDPDVDVEYKVIVEAIRKLDDERYYIEQEIKRITITTKKRSSENIARLQERKEELENELEELRAGIRNGMYLDNDRKISNIEKIKANEEKLKKLEEIKKVLGSLSLSELTDKLLDGMEKEVEKAKKEIPTKKTIEKETPPITKVPPKKEESPTQSSSSTEEKKIVSDGPRTHLTEYLEKYEDKPLFKDIDKYDYELQEMNRQEEFKNSLQKKKKLFSKLYNQFTNNIDEEEVTEEHTRSGR